MKLLALISTFVIPTRDAVGKFGGMSPAVNIIFDNVIVPGVQKVHGFMGNDPKCWAKLQLSLLPFVLVDWFILPGLLTSEEERHVARARLRRDEDGRGVSTKRKRDVNANSITMTIPSPETFTHPIISVPDPSSDVDEPMQSNDLSSMSTPMYNSERPSEVFKDEVMNTKSNDDSIDISLIDEPSLQSDATKSAAMDNDNESYRPISQQAKSEVGLTGEEILRDLASIRKRTEDDAEKRRNRNLKDDARRRRCADRVSENNNGGEGIINETPSRRVIGSTLPVDRTPTVPRTSRDNFGLFPRTTPTIVDRLSSSTYPADIFANKDQFDDSIITPDARRLLESTASKLKRFSPRLSPSIDMCYYEELHVDGGECYNENNTSSRDERQVTVDILKHSSLLNNKIEEPSTTRRQRVTKDGRRSRRRERLSLGDHLRELVTGDANIPIRDHLFDLDLPSTPEKKRGIKEGNIATIHPAFLPVMLPIIINNTDVSMTRPLLPARVDNSDESSGDPCIPPTKESRTRQKHKANMQQEHEISPHVTTRRKSSRLAKKKDS